MGRGIVAGAALLLALASGCVSATEAGGEDGCYEWSFADVRAGGAGSGVHVGGFRYARKSGAPARCADLGERGVVVWRDLDADGRRDAGEPVALEVHESAPTAAFELGGFDAAPGEGPLRCEVRVLDASGEPLCLRTQTLG